MPNHTGLLAVGAVALAMATIINTADARVAHPDLVPAKSAFVISIPDGPGLVKASKANSLISAIDGQLSPFIKEKLEEEGANEKIASLEKVLGFDLNASNIASTFKSLDAYVLPGASEDDTAVGFIVTVGDAKRADQIISLATMAVTEAVSGSDKKPTTSEYKGLTITKYGEDESAAFVIRDGDFILLSNKESEIKALADRHKDKSGDAISGLADYKTVSEALAGDDAHIFLYSNTETLQSLMQSADNSGNPFNEVVGKLQPTKFNGATIKLDPKAIVSVSAATLGDGGVAEYFKNNPGKTIDSVNFATAGALFFLGTSMIDSKAIAAGIQELSGSLPGGEELKANATGAEGMLGFSLADDLVPAIGNEFAIVVNKVDLDSGPFPSVDAGIIIKVGDKAKMEKIISSLEKLGANALQGQELQKAKIAGADVKFVPVPVPFVQPGFTVHDGYLIIGTTKSGITALLETKGGKESLVRSDAFKKLAPRVSANGQTLSYINLGAIAQIALKAAKDRVGEDKDAQAIVRRISDVAKTLGALGGIQKVKDGLLYSENVLNLN